MKKLSIRNICLIGMFTAVICVLSILQIPTPWGVPFTLQTFVISLAGYCLGMFYGTASVVIYVLLGLIGLPVFAGMQGGPQKLVGPTGGYIYGFIFMALLCGLAYKFTHKKAGFVLVILISLIALAACHIPGIIQFSLLANMGFKEAALLASVPYLLKDILSMVAAYFVALALHKSGVIKLQ